MHGGCRSVAHLLPVDVDHADLDGEAPATPLLRDVGWHLECHPTLLVGQSIAFGDQAAIAAIILSLVVAPPLIIRPTVPRARLARWARVLEPVLTAEHAPVDVCAGDRAAKVVGSLGADIDLFTSEIGSSVSRHHHLILWFLVLGHLEAGAGEQGIAGTAGGITVRVLDLDMVVAQRCLLVQHQFVVEGTHVAEPQLFLVQLFTLGIRD